MPILLLFLSLTLPRPAAAASTDTLTVCDDVQDPMTLDPQKQFTEKNHTLLQQVYEGLVRFDAEGRITPALAESWERHGPLRTRFKLRRGVKFHDGETFDSRAVVFSISRYLDPATGFPALGFINSIEKAEAVDPYTVDIVTRFPDGLLMNRLAGFILIIAPDFIRKNEESALLGRSAGTGPFKLNRWDRGVAVYLDRNPDYWGAGFPKMNRLIFKFLPAEKLLDAFKTGEIDLATELPGTLTTQISQTGYVQVVKKPSFYTVAASLNLNRGPLQSESVRQALNYGINKQELIRYDLLGNGREIATVTMAGEEGHNDQLSPYPYDPNKAKKLLRAAGYPNGFTLRAAVKNQGARAAQIIAKQLKNLGVTIELHTFADAESAEALKREPWDIMLGGCPDPMANSFFIQSIFLYSASPYSLTRNGEYDSRLERMVGTLDDAERLQIAMELDRYIHDRALMLFLYQRIKTYGVRHGVTFAPPVTGMPYFFDVSKTTRALNVKTEKE